MISYYEDSSVKLFSLSTFPMHFVPTTAHELFLLSVMLFSYRPSGLVAGTPFSFVPWSLRMP